MLKDPYETKKTPRTQQELTAILHAHERYLKYQGGLRAQLAHTLLNGLNLANRDLRDADFTGASLVGASLYGSNLQQVSLYCADLRDCDLRMAKLIRTDLRGASFRGARLNNAVLDFADLRSGMMMYVGQGAASIVDHQGEGEKSGKSHGVDFSNCSMRGASFGNAKLEGANFTGALLQGASFKNAKLTNVIFKNAVLTNVNLAELVVPADVLESCVRDVTPEAGAKLEMLKSRLEQHQRWISSDGRQGERGVLDGEDLRPLQKLLAGRRLSGLLARKTIGIGLDFSGCQLQAAKLDQADLRGADFTRADLRGASLKGANLMHANLDKADMRPLPLSSGGGLAVNLEEAAFTEEQLGQAIRNLD